MNPRRALSAALALLVLGAGCAPKNEVNIGLKDYPTDVVYGEPTTTTLPPPPTQGADLTPGFPSFLVPAPPAPTVEPVAVIVGSEIITLEDPCPIAGPGANRIATGPKVTGTPSAGTYTYRQEGGATVNGAKTTLAPLGQRTVKNVKVVDGVGSWDVAITELGVTTTTTYQQYRSGSGSTDGLYITRVVQEAKGRTPEEFAPIQPGLRILPEPTGPGAAFTSVATDVIHGVSMIIDATVKEVRQLDVCGVILEGWAVDAKVQVRRPGLTTSDDYTTTASYVVAGGLGGLIVADSIKQAGTSGGVTLDRSTSSVLADLGVS